MSISKKASVASYDEFVTCQSIDPAELREAFPNLVVQQTRSSANANSNANANANAARLSISTSAATSTNVSRNNSHRSAHRLDATNHLGSGDQQRVSSRRAKRSSNAVGPPQPGASLPAFNSFDSNDSLKDSREFYSLPDSTNYPSAPVRRIEPLFERLTMLDMSLGFLRFVAAAFLLLLFGLVMCILVPIAKLCRLIVLAWYSQTGNRMVALSMFEAIWFPDLDALTFDRAVVQCFLLIEDRVELAQIRELLQTRLLNARLNSDIVRQMNRNSRRRFDGLLYPRYTEKLVPTFLGYAWKTDDRFSIANHLSTVPSVRTRAQLIDYFSTLTRAPLDRDRPLWQVHVAYPGERETALIIRVHPALGEPLELVHVLCNHPSMLQDQTLASHLIGTTRSRWDVFRALTKRAVCAFWTPYFFVSHFSWKAADSNMLHGTIEPRIDNMQMRFVRAPLRDLTKLQNLTNTDCIEMYFSLLAGAVRAYEQFYGLEHPFDHTALAFSIENAPFAMWLKHQNELRTSASKLRGCHHSNFFCEMRLPSNTEACLPRLWTVQYRDAPEAFSVRMYLPIVFDSLFMILPSRRFSRLVSSYYEKATCTMAYQHGSESALMLGSHEIRELVVWQTPPPNLSTSVVFTNYAGSVSVAVCADQRIMPNIELLLRAIQNQIDILTEQLARKKTFSDDEMMIEGKPRAGQQKHRVTLASIEARLRRLSEDPHEPAAARTDMAEMTNEDIQKMLENIQSELDEHEHASANASGQEEKAAMDRKVQGLRNRFQMVIHETVRRNRLAAGHSNSSPNASSSWNNGDDYNNNSTSYNYKTTAPQTACIPMNGGRELRNLNRPTLRNDRHTQVDIEGSASPRPPSVVLTTFDEEVIDLSGYDYDQRDFENPSVNQGSAPTAAPSRIRERRRSSSLPFLTTAEHDESGFASAQPNCSNTPQFSSLSRPLRPVSANSRDASSPSECPPQAQLPHYSTQHEQHVMTTSLHPSATFEVQDAGAKANTQYANGFVKLPPYFKLIRRSTAPI